MLRVSLPSCKFITLDVKYVTAMCREGRGDRQKTERGRGVDWRWIDNLKRQREERDKRRERRDRENGREGRLTDNKERGG